jgi:tripartite-type tricarboxylate transporter receptor subunit TctC
VLPPDPVGKVRALAVTSAKRNPQLPNVPTMAEAGVKGVEMVPGTASTCRRPRPRRCRSGCTQEVTKVLAMPETRSRLSAIGAEITPMTQAQFAPSTTPRTSATPSSSSAATSGLE